MLKKSFLLSGLVISTILLTACGDQAPNVNIDEVLHSSETSSSTTSETSEQALNLRLYSNIEHESKESKKITTMTLRELLNSQDLNLENIIIADSEINLIELHKIIAKVEVDTIESLKGELKIKLLSDIIHDLDESKRLRVYNKSLFTYIQKI